MIEIGSKVRIKNVPVSCCGVIAKGWQGIVIDMLPVFELNEDGTQELICILDDYTLCWYEDLELVQEMNS